MVRRIIFFFVFILIALNKILAQVDPHFSQFYAYPLWLNPGMTGVMDGEFRVTGIYRNQWNNVMMPFSTAGLSMDMATEKNLNFGINVLSQSAGDAGYQYLNAYASVAYSGIRFGKDKEQQVTFGVQAGLLSRKFDQSKFEFGDQWNPITGYNPGAITADVFTKTSSSVFDIGAGISYFDAGADKKANLFAGIAAFHLNQPQDPFVSNGVDAALPIRYAMHAGVRIALSEMASVTPNLLYMRQGNAEEKMIGLSGQYNITDNTDILLGVNYRFKDAIAPLVGVVYQNFILGLSYDVNTSELGKAVTGTNSFEISFTYKSRKSGKSLRYLSCPIL